MTEIRPISTVLRLGTCNRCSGYVLTCQTDGLKTAVDPAPLDGNEAYIAALVAGKGVYDLVEQAGRPHKLIPRTPRSPAPPWSPWAVSEAHSASRGGPRPLSGRPILVEHGCGAHGMDASKVEVTPVGPPQAPVTPGRGSTGHLRPPVPAEAGRRAHSPFPAGHATPRPSEHPGQPACERCGYRIAEAELFIGIHCGTWIWAEHDGKCPYVEKEAPSGAG